MSLLRKSIGRFPCTGLAVAILAVCSTPGLLLGEGEDDFETLWESSYDRVQGVDVSQRIRVEDIVEPPSDYRYSSFGRGDPFQPPYMQVQVAEEAREAELRRFYEIPIVSGLQVPLDQLKVEGIWVLPNRERRAMIRTAVRNEGIIAKVGDPIGLAGKIVDITDSMVVAREYFLHEDGSRTYEDRVMFLGDPNERLGRDRQKRVVLRPGETPVIKESNNIIQTQERAP